jgi:hypothetical protein
MASYKVEYGDLPIRKFDTVKFPDFAAIARDRLALKASTKPIYLDTTLTRAGAIAAVDRIMQFGCNEFGKPLQNTLWFRQQLRLTADWRLSHLFTTGASQISKSVANYLVAIDTLLNGQINIGWFYASRQSLYNQQPEQFQAMVKGWVSKIDPLPDIDRDATTRFTIGAATGHFSYVNSASEVKAGGAAEGKEATAFSASVLFLEERSGYRGNVDVTPRLGASQIASKPIRELGTPGGGAGIGKLMQDSAHIFCPGLICPTCKDLTWLEPKAALLKSRINPKNKKVEYFGNRGEILEFHSIDGTADTAFIACVHCGSPIPPELIIDCQLYSKQTGESADRFLDDLPDGIYPNSIGIYLSPLLRVPSDSQRIRNLIIDGLDPLNPLIYCQNKLGYESELGGAGVSIEQFNRVIKLTVHDLDRRVPSRVLRFAGIDQNRGLHHIVIAELVVGAIDRINIVHIGLVSQDMIKPLLTEWGVAYALIDNEPDRLDSYRICQEMAGKLHLADQREIKDAYSKGSVSHGAEEMPCFFLSNQLFIEQVVRNWESEIYRVNCKVPVNFAAHISSMRRDEDTQRWIRPNDSQDHYFFAMLFLEAAIVIYATEHKPTRQHSTGKPLARLKQL